VVANLVIDTITYDQVGDVALGGRGAANSFARIYVNDQPIETVQIAPDGSWASPLPDIDAGVYRLRIDEVDADGRVTSRVETPFQREAPELAAEAIQRPNAVTVQEGFTLWAIAEDRFGDGIEYVRVYEANRDLIRDPDLIYPGQVFEIPEG
jgi:nucleoid-associated protein YgaU